MLLAVFNDGAMIALSKDRVVASPMPNTWNLKAIFISGIVYGLYLTISSWALFFTASKTQVSMCKLTQAVHSPIQAVHSPIPSGLTCLVAGPCFSCFLTSIAVNAFSDFSFLFRAVLQGQMPHVLLEHKDIRGLPLLSKFDYDRVGTADIYRNLHGEAIAYASILFVMRSLPTFEA